MPPELQVPQIVTCSNDNKLSLRIPIQLKVRNRTVETEALIDSGAEGIFIDHWLAKENWIRTTPLGYQITARNVDGTANQNRTIARYADVDLAVGTLVQPEHFLVTNLGTNKVILGLPWLERHNPKIDWRARLVELIDQVTTEATQYQAKQAILQELTITAFTQQEALKHKDTRTAEEMVPKQYHKFLTVFDKKAAERFPPSRPYDHAINLKPGFTPRAGKVYLLPVTEQKLQDEFLDFNLWKGYIRPSQSPESAPLFFTGKKDGSARPVQDYRRINEWTVKNAYPSPLTKELMDKLQKAKYFTKLDL